MSQLFIGGLAGVGVDVGAGTVAGGFAAGACENRAGAELKSRAANRKGDGFMRRILNCAAIGSKIRTG